MSVSFLFISRDWWQYMSWDGTPEFWSRRFSWTSVRAKFAPNYVTSVDSFIFADTVWPLFIFVRYSWYCQKKYYFRYTFEADTPQPAGGSLLLNPLTTLFLLTWMTNLGRQAYWWTALEEEVAGEVAASPRGSSKPSRPAYFSNLFTHFKGFR